MVKIWKRNNIVAFPAFFNHGQVGVIGDFAVSMEIVLAVERIEDRVVYVCASTGVPLLPLCESNLPRIGEIEIDLPCGLLRRQP